VASTPRIFDEHVDGNKQQAIAETVLVLIVCYSDRFIGHLLLVVVVLGFGYFL
jgi:hypothetical protein